MSEATLSDVAAEVRRQRDLWGEQNHPDGTGLPSDKACADFARLICDTAHREARGTWRDILHEEVCEAFAETDTDKLRTELVQVAAVASSWVDAIDRRAAGG